MMNPCNVLCSDQVYCLHSGAEGEIGDCASLNGRGFNGCDLDSLQHLANQSTGAKELSPIGIGNARSDFNGL